MKIQNSGARSQNKKENNSRFRILDSGFYIIYVGADLVSARDKQCVIINKFRVTSFKFEKSRGVLHMPLMIYIKTVGQASPIFASAGPPVSELQKKGTIHCAPTSESWFL